MGKAGNTQKLLEGEISWLNLLEEVRPYLSKPYCVPCRPSSFTVRSRPINSKHRHRETCEQGCSLLHHWQCETGAGAAVCLENRDVNDRTAMPWSNLLQQLVMAEICIFTDIQKSQ